MLSTFTSRALGWVNHRRAERLLFSSPHAALDKFQRASADYVRAADILNEDEEYHARELNIPMFQYHNLTGFIRLLIGRCRVYVDGSNSTQRHISSVRAHQDGHPEDETDLGIVAGQRLTGHPSTAGSGL